MKYWPKRVFQAAVWLVFAFILVTSGYVRFIQGLGWWSLLYLVLGLSAAWYTYRALRGYVYWYGNPNKAVMHEDQVVEDGEPFEVHVHTGLDGLTLTFEATLSNEEDVK